MKKIATRILIIKINKNIGSIYFFFISSFLIFYIFPINTKIFKIKNLSLIMEYASSQQRKSKRQQRKKRKYRVYKKGGPMRTQTLKKKQKKKKK